MNLVQILKAGVTSLLSDLPLSAQFRLGLKTSADIDNAVNYAIEVSRGYMRRLADNKIQFQGAHILEIGPGLDFAPQLVLASAGATVTIADRFLSNWDDAYHPEFYRRFRSRWSGPADAIDSAISLGGYDGLIVRLAEPAEALTGISDASCDAVLSTSVLEHVYNLPAVCSSLARVTKPGGVGIHSIDFRDHWSNDRPLDFLLFPSDGFQAKLTRGRIGRGNRLRPSEHLARFREAGFIVKSLEPYAPPSIEYFDDFLPKLRASQSPYRDSPVDDLILGALLTVVRAKA